MDIEKLYSEISTAAVGEIEKIDGSQEWLRNNWQTGIGTFDIAVFRGRAIEKASIARISLEVKKVVEGPAETLHLRRVDGLQVNIYPANPLLPVALFNLERRQLASGITLGGYISIFPMSDNEDITARINGAYASIVTTLGKSKEQALQEYQELWHELDWNSNGGKGIGIKISGGDANLSAMKTAVQFMVKSALGAIAEKKDVAFSDEDAKNMHAFRFKLAEFILIKDPSSKVCFEKVKFETLSSMILPPVVRF